MSAAPGHTGAVSESLATAFLLKRGYEVFRNVSAHGPIDLIAVHARTGEVRLYDVKTRRNSEGSNLTKAQIRIGVRLLLVEPDLGVVTENLSEFRKLVATERLVTGAAESSQVVAPPIRKRKPTSNLIPAFLLKSKSASAQKSIKAAVESGHADAAQVPPCS